MSRVSYWTWDNDWSQTRAINEIDQELEAERLAQQRRLRAARAEFNSGLKQVDRKLSSVSGRIDTVLEWVDLRFQLIEFDEYMVRRAVRRPFQALAGGLPASAPDVEDVPGYWMPPAAVALLRLVARGGSSSGAFADLGASLELARERDAVRSELFTLAVALCFDQPAFVDASVLRLLAEPADLGQAEPGEVAAGWRSLWEHTALGEFGPSAAALLRERLGALFDPESIDEEELKVWDEAIRSFGSAERGRLPEHEAFALLREHLSAAVAPPASGAVFTPDDRWRHYLQELIEEPSPAELPLVKAMEELHLPEDHVQRSQPAWADSEGTVAELLRRDLFDPEGLPEQRGLALEVCAPLLRSRIERLGEAAASAEPITRVVKRVGARVVVGRDGHDPAELQAAERRIERSMASGGPSSPVTAAVAGGFGALTLVLLLTGLWPLAVLCLIGVVAPLWNHARGRSRQRLDRQLCERQIAALHAEVARAKESVREDEEKRRTRLAALARAREELSAVLPAASSGAAGG